MGSYSGRVSNFTPASVFIESTPSAGKMLRFGVPDAAAVLVRYLLEVVY